MTVIINGTVDFNPADAAVVLQQGVATMSGALIQRYRAESMSTKTGNQWKT